MKRLIIIAIILAGMCTAYAEDSSRAYMKVQYDDWKSYYNDNDTTIRKIFPRKYILQIATGASYYYDPQTYRIDSLESIPEGQAMLMALGSKLMQERMNGGPEPYYKMKEMGFTRGQIYRARKDFSTGKITVWDSSGGDKYRYDTDMADMNWEICDSTKNIMGYECMDAVADYHGRKWKAWFAPELAVQDGPWQLCGLPGLILEAYSLDGDYGFSATGIQQCDEMLKDPFETDKYFHSDRIAFLKSKDYTNKHRAEMISVMTGGKVKPTIAKQKKSVDLIETDYH